MYERNLGQERLVEVWTGGEPQKPPTRDVHTGLA